MRVIAGTHRGRSLQAPSGSATRPTTDRVREALFSILGDMQALCVLDLYAGTGALGIEALSRGASRAVFVESSRHALLVLRQNLTNLELGTRAIVLGQPAEKCVARVVAEGPFDLVFCDPPWAQMSQAVALLSKLAQTPWLTEAARVVVEHPSKQTSLPELLPIFPVLSERHWGDTAVSIFGRTAQ
jgi:16S rRNA (guanine966-N2)-methyltransferase